MHNVNEIKHRWSQPQLEALVLDVEMLSVAPGEKARWSQSPCSGATPAKMLAANEPRNAIFTFCLFFLKAKLLCRFLLGRETGAHVGRL